MIPTRAALAVIGLCLSATAMPVADAATTPTKPYLQVRSSEASIDLPYALVHGQWHVHSPGRSADLRLNGHSVTGVQTTITAGWISTPIPVRKQCTVFWYSFIDEHDEALRGVQPSQAVGWVRLQVDGHWQKWLAVHNRYAQRMISPGWQGFITAGDIQGVPVHGERSTSVVVQFELREQLRDTAGLSQRLTVNAAPC